MRILSAVMVVCSEANEMALSCRLINPCKSEIGKVSKQLLEKINNQLLEKLNVNQWRDTNKVIDWFVNLKDKQNSKFIQLDIKEFYPSIAERTLDNKQNPNFRLL